MWDEKKIVKIRFQRKLLKLENWLLLDIKEIPFVELGLQQQKKILVKKEIKKNFWALPNLQYSHKHFPVSP